MKGTLRNLILATMVLGVGLWVGAKWFVGETYELVDNIDVRSLSHLREGYQGGGSSGSSADTQARSAPGKVTDPVNVGLRRLDSTPNFKAGDTGDQDEELQEEQQQPANDGQSVEEPENVVAEEDIEPIDEQSADNRESASPSESEVVPLTRAEMLEQAEIKKRTSLDEGEIEAREAVRRQRLADLGILPKKPPEPTIAVDASLEMPDQCSGAAIARVPIGLKFRFESSIIKGESLNALESLVALFRECADGQFILAQNPLGRTDATDTLIQMRFDEIKYFFIQHSVPIDAVQFPEK